MTATDSNKTVTQEDVARRAGVSRSIVSYVINNGPRKVSGDTRERVLAAIRDLGYRPNKHAQMLSAAEGLIAEKSLGIILAGDYMFKRPYYGSLLASMHERAHESGCHIRFIRLVEDFANPALLNELIHPDEVGGIILIGLDQVLETDEDRGLVKDIVSRVERVVCVEWEWPGVPSIRFDRQKAGEQATAHLLKQGCRRIAYIGPDDGRLIGYRQALWQGGISPDDACVGYAAEAHHGFERCAHLLETGVSIDGVCAGSDEVALGILNCLHRNGLRVPQDVAIASVDNLDLSIFTIPSLTTVNVPKEAIGSYAIDTLISDRLRGGAPAFVVTLPTELIVRESSVRKTV